MVRLKGPGLASKASGSVGGVLTFSTWKGRSYLKKTTAPTNPNSREQIAMRAVTRFCAQTFAALSTSDRATWQDLADSTRIPVYNAWLGECLRRWRERRPPTKTYPAAETGSGGTIKNLTCTQQGRRAIIRWKADSVAQNYGYIINWDTAGYPSSAWNNLIIMPLGLLGGTQNEATFALPLGWNYFRLNSFSVTGKYTGIAVGTSVNMV